MENSGRALGGRTFRRGGKGGKGMTSRLKKILCILLSISMLCSIPVFATGREAAGEEPIPVSVTTYPEITDEDALLELAVEQYETRGISEYSAYADGSEDEVVARQVLKETEYPDGTVVQDVATTTLAVLDDNQQKMDIAKAARTTIYDVPIDKTGNASGVYASMTVYSKVYFENDNTAWGARYAMVYDIKVSATKTTPNASCSRIRVNYLVTEMSYAHVDEETTFNSPASGQTYHYFTKNSNYFLANYPWSIVASANVYTSNGQQIYIKADV